MNYVMILDKPGISGIAGGPFEAGPTGHMMQSYWNPSETATKKKYSSSRTIPIIFVIFHLNIKIDKKKRQIISNKITTEHTMPSAKTGTDIDFISVTKSHGRGNLKQKISFQSVAVTVLLHYIVSSV